MKKVHIVPHSHWDREWYFTIEDSNALLVEHLDFLIDYLEKNEDYPYFVFDGQLSIVEEYLKYRPENEMRLTNLIKARRIHVGPWYTQCDSLNTKIESVIRNLAYGIHLGNKNGHTMNIGYLPDAFGQNAYLPSIFKSCNIDFSILQRGIYNDDAKNGINFNWVSPNGDEIKSNYIYFGYGPGKFLEASDNYLDVKLMPMLDNLNEMSFDADILLPSGGDQALIRTHFKDTIKEINQMQDDYKLELSSYEDFMESVDFSDVQSLSGELYACQKSRMHRTIHSQRVDLKILNNYVEKLLIENLEPLIVLAKKLDIQTNPILVDEMWKKMFDIHAHDSVGGCNSDSTNQKIMSRLGEVRCMAEGQINIITKKITKMVLSEDNGLVAFNLSNVANKKVQARIFTNTKGFRLLDGNQEVAFTYFNQTNIDGGSKVEVTNQGERQVKLPDYYQTDIEFELTDVKFGYKAYAIEEIEQELSFKEEVIPQKTLKTKLYDISIDEQLSISTSDVSTTISFEVQSDVGDSYDFAYLEGEKPGIFNKVKNVVVKSNLDYYIIDFDVDIKFKHVEFVLPTTLTISKNDDYIKFEHNFINGNCDYRIRTLFNKKIKNDHNTSDSGFGVVTRENHSEYIENWKELKFAEKPQCIYPFERFFKVDDLAIYNANVKEYEVIEDAVSLTLLRSVSHLGQDDLSTRPGRASGINNVVVMTPDAKMMGTQLSLSYHLTLINNDTYELYFKSSDNAICYQNQSLNLFENRLERFELPVDDKSIPAQLDVPLPKFNLSSAFVDLDGNIIYRLFNSKEDKDITITNYDFTGKKINKTVVNTNDYITIRDEDVK